jgi:hypothetical protein
MSAQPEPTTVHGQFIDHLQLAARWLAFNGRPFSDEAVLRVASRYTREELRQALAPIAEERIES